MSRGSGWRNRSLPLAAPTRWFSPSPPLSLFHYRGTAAECQLWPSENSLFARRPLLHRPAAAAQATDPPSKEANQGDRLQESCMRFRRRRIVVFSAVTGRDKGSERHPPPLLDPCLLGMSEGRRLRVVIACGMRVCACLLATPAHSRRRPDDWRKTASRGQ